MADRAETYKRLTYYKELRDATITALKSLMGNSDIESYSFSDPNGSQNVHRRKISELQNALKEYESKIDNLERSLTGGGIRTLGTNRYG